MSAKMDIIEADDVKNVHVPHSVIFLLQFIVLFYLLHFVK